MYKTILVPLDGSVRAEAILPHVEDMALRYKARVVFLQVIEPTPPIAIGMDMAYVSPETYDLEKRTREAEAYLTSRQGEFRQKGIETRTTIAHGPVVETIINVAEYSHADLIAMASHGRTGLSRVFYGSVAAGVLHRIDRPLLLIRSSAND